MTEYNGEHLTGRRRYVNTPHGFVLQVEECVFDPDYEGAYCGRWFFRWRNATTKDLIVEYIVDAETA